MFKKRFAAILVAAIFATPLAALAHDHVNGDAATAQSIIKEIKADQAAYVTAHSSDFFKELAKGQHPRATVVTCSDSRVHTNMLDRTPEGDLFMIRNIGNQLATAKGSVQYGVNHLASSLLIFIGHSKCGAIAAAAASDADKAKLEAPIQKELETIGKVTPDIEGVKANVNNQVAAAQKEWAEQIKEGHLVVVGAVYDFADDMKQGAGQLNIININGETDPVKMSKLPAPAAAADHEHAHAHH